MAEFRDVAEGTLVIIVCRARHLPNRRKLDKQSPYVLLRINTTAQKTPAHFRAGQTPEWTHEIRFQLSRDRKAVMRLDVLDETKSDPTPIGGTEIDCARVFSDPANAQESGKYILDGWHDLSCKGKYAGKIYLEMTFYPSAPMLPPKLSQSISSAHKSLPQAPTNTRFEESFRHSAPATSVSPSRPEIAASDVFVSSPPGKTHPFRSSEPEPAHKSDDGVFVEHPRQKVSRFAKLKGKFLAKEPITNLWAHDEKPAGGRSPNKTSRFDPNESLMHAPSPLDNLEELSLEMGIHGSSSEDYFPRHSPATPPPPPPHSASGSTSMKTNRQSYYDDRLSRSSSPVRSAPSSPSKNRRKPPPGAVGKSSIPPLDSTKIPFSAENFQLDSEAHDPLPTKVYHMDMPVKSLTVQASERETHPLNPNELDPRYYAPTPSEHLSRSSRLQKSTQRFEESETRGSGYLGEGSWNVQKDMHGRFSPSVFQRITHENDDEENKPPVPPKIPSGLSEREYYVLEKDNYLKDINGRRY